MGRVALILGGGDRVWIEAREARAMHEPDAFIAVNDAGCAWPDRLDIWATLHSEKLAGWVRQRAANGYQPCARLAVHVEGSARAFAEGLQPAIATDYRWPESSGSGSSGLFAVKVALEEGFDRIVLCGVPMDGTRHFFRGNDWSEYTSFRRTWERAAKRIEPHVRSMGGWTRDRFGAPSVDWLEARQ